jgi:hypothetical protein
VSDVYARFRTAHPPALDRLPALVQIGMSIRAAAPRPQPMIFMNVSLLLL